MNYTNKELAAQCLIEAAELLSESAGKNGLFRKIANASDCVPLTRSNDPDLTDACNNIRHQKGNLNYKYENARKGNRNSKSEKCINGDFYDPQNNEEMTADEFIAYNNYDKKSNPVHKKINNRASKSKNESVDISSLLREAADLLED